MRSFFNKMRAKTLLLLFTLFALNFICVINSQFFPDSDYYLANFTLNESAFETGRKKKKDVSEKYLVPLLFGALLVKSIIFPVAFKAMGILSAIAVLLSSMSLIMSSMVGFLKLARKSDTPVEIIHKLPSSRSKSDELKKKEGTILSKAPSEHFAF